MLGEETIITCNCPWHILCDNYGLNYHCPAVTDDSGSSSTAIISQKVIDILEKYIDRRDISIQECTKDLIHLYYSVWATSKAPPVIQIQYESVVSSEAFVSL